MSKSFMAQICLAVSSFMPVLALAHDGHGNTPAHAVMHMLEANGGWIGLVLVIALGSLVYRALRIRSARNAMVVTKESEHDPR